MDDPIMLWTSSLLLCGFPSGQVAHRPSWLEGLTARFMHQRRLFYTSPITLTNPGDWPELETRLRRAVTSSCGKSVDLVVESKPRFAPIPAEPIREGAPAWEPDTDTEETLLAIAEDIVGPRTVRIELWSTYPGYSAICITLGGGIQRKERRELLRRVPKAAKRQCQLLYEHEADGTDATYDVDTARVVAFRLDPDDDADRAEIENLLFPIDQPFYLCERWCVQGEDGRVDEERYTIHREFGPDLVFCAPHESLSQEESKEAQVELWSRAARGEGLYAVYPDEAGLDTLALGFSGVDELSANLIESHATRLRITVGRGQSSLVVAFNSCLEWIGGVSVVLAT